MKKWMMAGLLLVILVSGCDEQGAQGEEEIWKKVKDYEPRESDIVDTHGKIENLERFEEFYKNVKNGVNDKIRIVTYTVEGDPILQDISFDGKVFESKMDTRRDKYGPGDVEILTCKKIESADDNNKVEHEYKLTNCGEKQPEVILLWY
ncbi:DUF4362 domain-containing protein [Lysinibacillus sphaericus]